LLEARIKKQQLGKKTGKGFYTWEKGKSDRKPVDLDRPYGDQLAERLMKRFLAECEAVSRDGIVADDELLDGGIVFGTGFAPFLGGPMNYLNMNKPQRQSTTGDSTNG
jgi:3-hydroxyacyl-CoA dehydrogenase/enoyl-CoA hydratase/3-hydroxybutyryl-CoA epimerase